MKAPAYLVISLIVLILLLLGVYLFYFASSDYLSNDILYAQYSLAMLVVGIFLLMLGMVGPVRVVYKGAEVPAEIKWTIRVLAFTITFSGLIFIVAGMLQSAVFEAWSFFLVGLLSIISGLIGFYPLSKKLPKTFYIGEMLSIIKSAGISGDKKNSPANQAIMRWTQGRSGVSIGRLAPDSMVTTMADERVLLSSFFSEKLLVLNFASYSCPHHRKRMNELKSLMQQWKSDDVDFLTIYTAEAHTEDGWKLADQYVNDDEFTQENDFCFFYAKTLDERKKMAEWLIEKKHLSMPVVIDSMDDTLLKAYNSWPIRLYIIKDSQVVYCGDQGPFGYEPSAVNLALKRLLKKY